MCNVRKIPTIADTATQRYSFFTAWPVGIVRAQDNRDSLRKMTEPGRCYSCLTLQLSRKWRLSQETEIFTKENRVAVNLSLQERNNCLLSFLGTTRLTAASLPLNGVTFCRLAANYCLVPFWAWGKFAYGQ